jgi:hypothetical protein
MKIKHINQLLENYRQTYNLLVGSENFESACGLWMVTILKMLKIPFNWEEESMNYYWEKFSIFSEDKTISPMNFLGFLQEEIESE